LFQDGHCVPASQQKQNPSIKALHKPSLIGGWVSLSQPHASHIPAAESASVTKKTVQDPEIENPKKTETKTKTKRKTEENSFQEFHTKHSRSET
jgi:hypothetical protein